MTTTRTHRWNHQLLTDILLPVAIFVSWFSLGAYLLSKYASPLMDLL